MGLMQRNCFDELYKSQHGNWKVKLKKNRDNKAVQSTILVKPKSSVFGFDKKFLSFISPYLYKRKRKFKILRLSF